MFNNKKKKETKTLKQKITGSRTTSKESMQMECSKRKAGKKGEPKTATIKLKAKVKTWRKDKPKNKNMSSEGNSPPKRSRKDESIRHKPSGAGSKESGEKSPDVSTKNMGLGKKPSGIGICVEKLSAPLVKKANRASDEEISDPTKNTPLPQTPLQSPPALEKKSSDPQEEEKSGSGKKDVEEAAKKYVDDLLVGGLTLLKNEFKSVNNVVSDEECATFLKNMSKNRYPNIPCIDRTRVIISNDDNFYIHANKVRVGPISDRFVCTQGPLESTINDFWRMAMDLETNVIIMLCGFVEKGATKCAKYFPSESGETMECEFAKVVNESTAEFSENTSDKVFQTNLKIVVKSTSKEMKVTHYQWTNWPDHSMPETCDMTLKLLAILRKSTKSAIVHCSAGVGRTGTFVLVESMITCLQYPRKSNIKEAFATIRKDRAKMVQTFPQFVYANRCAMEYVFSKGCSKNEEQWEKFKEQYGKFMRRKKRKSIFGRAPVRKRSSASCDIDDEPEKRENEQKQDEPDAQKNNDNEEEASNCPM